MKRVLALVMAMALVVVSLGSVAAQSGVSQDPVDPKEGCNYYEETGHNLCGIFLTYWEGNGELPVFGFPITEAFEEVNLDTDSSYLVQYFERERMEHHPVLAGSVYEVLLGRLGNEVLQKRDRDWQSFEKSNPSEANYFAETGFAVPAVFMEYWSSHGLDFGDEGDKGRNVYSFRESLALFGYPISQAEVETNADGDTVLTQWFERARFEYHPDNDTEHQVLLGRLGDELLELGLRPDFEVIASGLENPRGIAFGPDDALYVVEAGVAGDECVEVPEPPAFGDPVLCFGETGAVTRVADGTQERIASGLPSHRTGGQITGAQDIAIGEDGQIFLTIGYAQDPAYRNELSEIAAMMGRLISLADNGTFTSVADLAAYELEANPEQEGGDHSNPYGFIIQDDGFVVVDSAGNDLLHVANDGTISTLAIFPPQMVEMPPGPDVPPGTMIPMASVPTSVAVGPDGAYYVGEFTGFPFVPGTARIWRVVPGQAPEVYATGFTAVIDLTFDDDGRLYVLEAVRNGLGAINPADPSSLNGALIRLDTDNTRTILAGDGLLFPTSVLIGPDGMIYVTNNGIVPGQGQVLRFRP